MRTSNITKLRTCGCGLQDLRSCGLAVADFKNYEVADLRLRTKLLNVQMRTCGCGLRKLKFGCGFADCRLKKKLAVPSTAKEGRHLLILQLKCGTKLVQCIELRYYSKKKLKAQRN